LSSLENQINNYKTLKNNYSSYASNNLIKIEKIISEKKEQLIKQLLEKNEVNSKDIAQNLLNDILTNNWSVSDKIIDSLIWITKH